MADPTYGERAEAARQELTAIKAEQEAEVKEYTEALAAQPGFPIQTDDGEVLVVRKEAEPNGFITAIAEDGTEYRSIAAGSVVFSKVEADDPVPTIEDDE